MENAMILRCSSDDFNRIFEDNMPKYGTQKAAYEAAENIHFQKTGTRRYSDLDSFRRVRRRRMRK